MQFRVLFFCLIILSCTNEVIVEPTSTFDINNIQIELDKFDNELFLQAEVDYWDGNENIISVNAELSFFNNGGYQSIGIFSLSDDGESGDIISNNGIYSLLTTAEDFVMDVEPEIKQIMIILVKYIYPFY